ARGARARGGGAGRGRGAGRGPRGGRDDRRGHGPQGPHGARGGGGRDSRGGDRGQGPAARRLRGDADRPRRGGARGRRGAGVSALLPVYERELVLVSGKGARLVDRDGKSYLDFAAGIGVNGLGYGDRKIVAAIRAQAAKLIHASNLFHTEPAARLAERLAALAFPCKVFFCNSGTEAWEAAMKFARRIGRAQG